MTRRKSPIPSVSLYRKTLSRKNEGLLPAVNKVQLSIWVEYWNSQKGLIKHWNPQTKIYRRSHEAVEKLIKTGWPKKQFWDAKWIARHGISEKILTQPWSRNEIKRSIRILSMSTEPGNWPGPNSWLSRMPMQLAIYNPRSGISMLAYARCRICPQRLRTSQDSRTWESVGPQAQTVAAPMRSAGIDIWPTVAEKMSQQYNKLLKDNPLLAHLSGGLEGFGRMMARWLQEQNELKPGSKIEPPNGPLWKRFLSTFHSSEDC